MSFRKVVLNACNPLSDRCATHSTFSYEMTAKSFFQNFVCSKEIQVKKYDSELGRLFLSPARNFGSIYHPWRRHLPKIMFPILQRSDGARDAQSIDSSDSRMPISLKEPTALSFSGEASRIYRILHSCFYVLDLQ